MDLKKFFEQLFCSHIYWKIDKELIGRDYVGFGYGYAEKKKYKTTYECSKCNKRTTRIERIVVY